MDSPQLTPATIYWLFADRWAAPAETRGLPTVSGARVLGPETAANLLSLAVWSLREQGIVRVDPRVAAAEGRLASRVSVLGGRSRAHLDLLDPTARRPGLEGKLLEAVARERAPGSLKRVGQSVAAKARGEQTGGLREDLLAIGFDTNQPWVTVANRCRDEAVDAGVIAVEGRLRKRIVIANAAALADIERSYEELVGRRDRFRAAEPELNDAVDADCAGVLGLAHESSG